MESAMDVQTIDFQDLDVLAKDFFAVDLQIPEARAPLPAATKPSPPAERQGARTEQPEPSTLEQQRGSSDLVELVILPGDMSEQNPDRKALSTEQDSNLSAPHQDVAPTQDSSGRGSDLSGHSSPPLGGPPPGGAGRDSSRAGSDLSGYHSPSLAGAPYASPESDSITFSSSGENTGIQVRQGGRDLSEGFSLRFEARLLQYHLLTFATEFRCFQARDRRVA